MKNKLNSSSKEYFERESFNQKQTIRNVEKWVNAYFRGGNKENNNKVFYHYYEWTGWRFYLKAIRHKDWYSIKRKLGLK